jgi:putative Holliday junction resolvase
VELILALDIGDTRTGIAQSDALGIFIKPLKTVLSVELDSEIKSLTEGYESCKIIVGLPKDKDGQEREQAQKTRAFAALLQEKYPNIEIIFEDEKFSSKEAESIIKSKGIKLRKDNKGLIDMYAAAILLEQYFNKQIQDKHLFH